MAAAISPGEATRPAGASAASWSSASPIISTPSVRVGPGETALTRTPLGPNSAAQALVSRFSAALLEPYRAMPALPNPPTMVVTLTIAPLPRAAMAGASSATRKNGTLTLIANVSSKVSSVVACVGPNEPPPALFTRMSTRQRIVAAAADLMFERGVAGTTVEDVRAAARVSSSQVYHYFTDKHALVRAVIEYQTDAIVGGQEPMLANLDSLQGLRAWRDFLVDHQRKLHCRGGCPIGSLGSELAETDPRARSAGAASFSRWEAGIRNGLRAMHARGELRTDAAPDNLALATLAALQGGLLLTQIQRQTRPLEVALDAMLDHVASLTAPA